MLRFGHIYIYIYIYIYIEREREREREILIDYFINQECYNLIYE